MEGIFKKKYIVMICAAICCALWGSATPFIKIGYELMMPEKDVPSTILFAGIRFFLAGIITIAGYSLARRKFLYPKKENLGKVSIVALFQTIIQYLFFYIGLANTTGVKGTVISGSNAFFAIIVSGFIFKQEKVTPKKLFACLIGFIGIIAVNLNGLDLEMNFMGDGFVLFSAIAYAVSSVLIKKFSSSEDPVVISGYQFAMGGAIMAIIGFCLGGSVDISSMAGFGVLIYLACLSAVAYSLWGVLLKHNPVSSVTIYTFLIPVFGVIFSKIMLSEQSSLAPVNLVVALLFVCGGIILSNATIGTRKKM